MELIDRYVYAVTEQLPEDMKEDVSKELRSNIEDMLPEDYTVEDVKAALEQLGNPWKIAEEYQPKQRYLIGPALYSQYIKLLKLVVGIVMTIVAAITAFDWVITPPSEGDDPSSFAEMLVEAIATVANGGLQAALWVTLIFVAIERGWFGITSTKGLAITDDSWSVKDLPSLPVQSTKISRTGTVIAMIAALLGTAIIYFRPELIGFYVRGDDGVYTIYSLLEAERLQLYIPFILVLVLIQMILFVWKYIVQYWNTRLWTVYTLASVLIGILLIIMVNDTALFQESFFIDVAQLFDASLSSVLKQREMIERVIVVSIVIITLWDAVDSYMKTRKVKQTKS